MPLKKGEKGKPKTSATVRAGTVKDVIATILYCTARCKCKCKCSDHDKNQKQQDHDTCLCLHGSSARRDGVSVVGWQRDQRLAGSNIDDVETEHKRAGSTHGIKGSMRLSYL